MPDVTGQSPAAISGVKYNIVGKTPWVPPSSAVDIDRIDKKFLRGFMRGFFRGMG